MARQGTQKTVKKKQQREKKNTANEQKPTRKINDIYRAREKKRGGESVSGRAYIDEYIEIYNMHATQSSVCNFFLLLLLLQFVLKQFEIVLKRERQRKNQNQIGRRRK